MGAELRSAKDTLTMLASWEEIILNAETAYEIEDEELVQEADLLLGKLSKDLDKFEFEQVLSGEYDYADARAAADQLEQLSREVEITDMVKLMKAIVPEFISKNSRFEELDK